MKHNRTFVAMLMLLMVGMLTACGADEVQQVQEKLPHPATLSVVRPYDEAGYATTSASATDGVTTLRQHIRIFGKDGVYPSNNAAVTVITLPEIGTPGTFSTLDGNVWEYDFGVDH